MAFKQTQFKSLADRLIKKNSMGAVSITRIVAVPAVNSWDTPTTVATTEVVDAIAFGVSSKYVDGVGILATDLMVTMTVPEQYAVGDIINVDGKPVTILQDMRVPAAGEPVMLKFIVRG